MIPYRDTILMGDYGGETHHNGDWGNAVGLADLARDTKSKPEIIVYSGIPTSGKSSHREKYENTHMIICRDDIRELIFGDNYRFTRDNENRVTSYVNMRFKEYTKMGLNIIIDQTNCKDSYLKEWVDRKPENYHLKIIFFDIPLYQAYMRNVIRWIVSGKFIPFKVIRDMKRNFDKLDKKKYEQYLF